MTILRFSKKDAISSEKCGETGVSLFCGCGGSALGYELAGFKMAIGVDWDKFACEAYRKNFPGKIVIRADVRKLRGEDLLGKIGRRPGEIGLLDGSPPCQTFSSASAFSKIKLADERSWLPFEFARLVAETKPKVFVMENVKGFVQGKAVGVFKETKKRLSAAGYRVEARLLDASYLGVPQKRKRVFLIGVRDDGGISPAFPKPSLRPATMGEVLDGARLVLARWKNKKNGFGEKFVLARPRDPSPTVTTVGIGIYCWIDIAKEDLSKDVRIREPLTTEDVKALCGFPPDFVLLGRKRTDLRLLGNSVPPPVTFHVGNALIKDVFGKWGSRKQ